MFKPSMGDIWVEAADMATWFKDADCTVHAFRPEDVRFLKNKGTGAVKSLEVQSVGKDSSGRWHFTAPLDAERYHR